MNITELKKRKRFSDFPKSDEVFAQFNEFIRQLNFRNFPDNTIRAVNNEVEELNTTLTYDVPMKVLINKKLLKIIRLIKKEHNVVPKNYYVYLSTQKGMTTFGIPIGVALIAIGIYYQFIALFVLGIPLGMILSFAIGTAKDKKAFQEGRQLDIKLNYKL